MYSEPNSSRPTQARHRRRPELIRRGHPMTGPEPPMARREHARHVWQTTAPPARTAAGLPQVKIATVRQAAVHETSGDSDRASVVRNIDEGIPAEHVPVRAGARCPNGR